MDAVANLRADGVRTDADALVIALFRAEGARLVQLARWFVDDWTAAEDLVQEAFLRLARNHHRINDQDRAAAYLRSIVINLARDHNRRGLVSLRHCIGDIADTLGLSPNSVKTHLQRGLRSLKADLEVQG